MARKFKLNEDKFKVAFIFANEAVTRKRTVPSLNPKKFIMYVVGIVLITVRQKL